MPLVIFGGKEYGTGSSRDWAAKGTLLLGVKAVIVESFERIHRSNLVGMGVLPLQFKDGVSRQSWADRRGDDRHHRRRGGPAPAHGADDAHPRAPTATCARSRSSAASTRWTRSNTTATAASCNTCCAAS